MRSSYLHHISVLNQTGFTSGKDSIYWDPSQRWCLHNLAAYTEENCSAGPLWWNQSEPTWAPSDQIPPLSLETLHRSVWTIRSHLHLSQVSPIWPAWKRGSFQLESTSKYSSVCAHMHFCLCSFVCESVQKGFGVLFIYSSACGRWPAERAEGHGKTSTLPHVSSFLRHPPCVVASTLCVVSGLLKIDPVRTVRRNTKAPRTFTNRGGIILKQQYAAFARPFVPNFSGTWFIVSRDLI